MDSSMSFFSKLRTVAVRLEKRVKELEQDLHGENTEYDDAPPVKVLHDLRCELSSLKEAFNATLHESCTKSQAINKFMKASEILMKRNEADLEEIRKLFQKSGYKTHVKDSTEEKEEEIRSDSATSEQNKSDEDKTDDASDLPAGTEKSLVPADPLRNPRLSDFGLSQYSLYRPWSAMEGLQTENVHQAHLNTRTPLKPLTPCTLPKTPKCKLKMDDYECITPKLERFGISEHTMCMNDDYTMSLMHKTAQTSKKLVKGDQEVTVQDMTPRKIMVTPRSKSKVTTENAANWMSSPMMPVFCTPDVKIPSRSKHTVLPKLPETNEQPLRSHAGTPQCPHFETRWIEAEAKFLNSSSGGKNESVTKNDATDKKHKEGSISFAESSDECLQHFRDPSPPKIKHYDQLLNTPPPPEITKIPDDVLQILCKYSDKIDSNTKEMETKTENATKYESDVTGSFNKEKEVAVWHEFNYWNN